MLLSASFFLKKPPAATPILGYFSNPQRSCFHEVLTIPFLLQLFLIGEQYDASFNSRFPAFPQEDAISIPAIHYYIIKYSFREHRRRRDVRQCRLLSKTGAADSRERCGFEISEIPCSLLAIWSGEAQASSSCLHQGKHCLPNMGMNGAGNVYSSSACYRPDPLPTLSVSGILPPPCVFLHARYCRDTARRLIVINHSANTCPIQTDTSLPGPTLRHH
jgi:hypothetical protein